ncbi:SipW-dependent-type signal peptide-containing protein [Brevibacillus composti]|uniref:SipW-dependent-type signal peptide-containing protein n=1 Tax=Brevibacillus composti TaxID=2796470 RepID=A0A7T5ELL4_9BACL|nr:TasA family protein [Brevibacillus composti]QQE74838.1 hypothetical protein JD108_02300 [Brevibacillus composti]QUO41922.1 SipW-dependent-type signal peptide-containing protein [Brevibacillus composti]
MKLGLKGKFGMALASTALGAALIGGGTFALFSDTAANEGNTFTAGTLTIEDVTGGAAFDYTVYFDNLAPGDSENEQLTIRNTGSLDAWVAIDTDNTTTTGALFEGDTPLTLTLDGDTVLIPAGGEATFDVSYNFPLEAGNEYQEATGTASIAIKAVQARNNTNAAGDGPTAWD